jgi:hypothetical protein
MRSNRAHLSAISTEDPPPDLSLIRRSSRKIPPLSLHPPPHSCSSVYLNISSMGFQLNRGTLQIEINSKTKFELNSNDVRMRRALGPMSGWNWKFGNWDTNTGTLHEYCRCVRWLYVSIPSPFYNF